MTAPLTDAQRLRDMVQRIGVLEKGGPTRIGDWVLHQDPVSGALLASRPGTDPLDVTNPPVVVADPGNLRGFVTSTQVANAVSGGSTSSLIAATQVQVNKDVATATAQYVADTANALALKVDAQLNAGATGYNFTDTFDRAAANDLGDQYTRTTDGSGAGAYGTDGAGFAVSTVVSGATAQRWTDQHITPTTTDLQIVASALDAPPLSGGGGGTVNSQHCLRARVSADGLDYVQAIVENGFIAMQYVLGGVAHDVVGGTPQAMGSGDAWSLQAGTDISTDQYVLLRNGLATPATWTDFGAVFPVDASHRFGSMSNVAGTIVYGWIFTTQIGAPKVQQFIVSDRTF